jgi:hypothetical protein
MPQILGTPSMRLFLAHGWDTSKLNQQVRPTERAQRVEGPAFASSAAFPIGWTKQQHWGVAAQILGAPSLRRFLAQGWDTTKLNQPVHPTLSHSQTLGAYSRLAQQGEAMQPEPYENALSGHSRSAHGIKSAGLPTAHVLARYRCFLPDLAGLAGLRRVGPGTC